VKRSWLSPAKVQPPRHAALASVVVPGVRQRCNVVLDGCISRPASRNVEYRFGAHTRDRGAADVFQSQRQGSTLAADPVRFGDERIRPPNVVLDKADDPGLETEWVRHLCGR
jgi:hypothetical protein